MQQNSDTWYKWRQQGLGASDSPIIMGLSKYMTPYQLWLEKTLPYEPKEERNTFVQDLGHHFEHKIINRFCLENEVDVEPELFSHEQFPWIRASLDGYIKETNQIIEVKYIGQKKLEWVKENNKPLPEHWPQTQHQFLATGAFTGYYVCYTLTSDRKEINEVVTIRTESDHKYIEGELFPQLQNFWNMVQQGKPPKLTKKDEKEIKDDDMINHARAYSALLKQKKELEEKIKIHETILKERALTESAGRLSVGPIKMTVSVRKGSVDYKAIPQLKDLDLEPFRKPATSYVTIKA